MLSSLPAPTEPPRNLLRRESLRETSALPETAKSGAQLPDRFAERRELDEALQGALAELTAVQREVVLLHDLEGWKHREIAERLELPSGTVRSHLHFARKALREMLEGVRGDHVNG